MTETRFTALESASRDIAVEALAAYRQDDKETAAALLGDLHARYWHPGLLVAMLTWADMVAAAAGPGVGFALFDDTDGGRWTSVDDAPRWAVWSARFISARGRRDHDQCQALLAICSGGGDQFTECFNGLLLVTARTLDAYEAGKPRRVAID